MQYVGHRHTAPSIMAQRRVVSPPFPGLHDLTTEILNLQAATCEAALPGASLAADMVIQPVLEVQCLRHKSLEIPYSTSSSHLVPSQRTHSCQKYLADALGFLHHLQAAWTDEPGQMIQDKRARTRNPRKVTHDGGEDDWAGEVNDSGNFGAGTHHLGKGRETIGQEGGRRLW